MRKVVWTSTFVAIAIACVGVTAASASGLAQPHRQQARKQAAKRLERQFKRLDQNGNGLIERSEWTRNPKLFDRLDRDHDGTLSPQEFRRLGKVLRRRRR